jgi:hypothetical protein
MSTLLSVFDYSGNWALPYEEAGWNVILWDVKHTCDLYSTFSDISDACTDYFYENIFDNYGTVDGILAAPPCTDFSGSGAQYWPKKDKDGSTARSVEMVLQTLRIIDLCQPDFWSMENPRGRMETLIPYLKDYRKGEFDPCDFTGYLGIGPMDLLELDRIRSKQGKDVTREERETIMKWEAYTKRTVLWGQFNMPTPNRVEPVKGGPWGTPLMSAGGASGKTKEYRSNTPMGFARAFCKANSNYGEI